MSECIHMFEYNYRYKFCGLCKKTGREIELEAQLKESDVCIGELREIVSNLHSKEKALRKELKEYKKSRIWWQNRYNKLCKKYVPQEDIVMLSNEEKSE